MVLKELGTNGGTLWKDGARFGLESPMTGKRPLEVRGTAASHFVFFAYIGVAHLLTRVSGLL